MTTAKLTPKLREVHAVVVSTGTRGATLSYLERTMFTSGLTRKALHQRLKRLREMNLVEQREERGPYFALESGDFDGAEERALMDRLLELIADCPSGVSDGVLAQETAVSAADVWRILQPALRAGAVVRVRMPAAHGGGKGFASGATANHPAGATAVVDTEALGAFELLDSSRLALAWDGARIVLPAGVTRGLFRYLDALSGLRTEQLLSTAERSTS